MPDVEYHLQNLKNKTEDSICENVLNRFFLPCSTTSEENSNLRLNWEQLESEDKGRSFGLEADLAPPKGSIPTKGRKPKSSPKSMDANTGSGIILSYEAV